MAMDQLSSDVRGARRPHPAGHPRAAGLGRVLGHRAGRAVRDEHAGRLEAPPRPRAGRTDRAQAARRSGGPAGSSRAPLKDVADWAERYRSIWEQRFDRLEAYLHN